MLLYNRITVTFARSAAYEFGLIFLCLVYDFYILTTRVVTAGLYLSSQNKFSKLTRFSCLLALFFGSMYTRQRMRSGKSIHLSLTDRFSTSTAVFLLSFITNTYKFQFDLIQEVFVRNYV